MSGEKFENIHIWRFYKKKTFWKLNRNSEWFFCLKKRVKKRKKERKRKESKKEGRKEKEISSCHSTAWNLPWLQCSLDQVQSPPCCLSGPEESGSFIPLQPQSTTLLLVCGTLATLAFSGPWIFSGAPCRFSPLFLCLHQPCPQAFTCLTGTHPSGFNQEAAFTGRTNLTELSL